MFKGIISVMRAGWERNPLSGFRAGLPCKRVILAFWIACTTLMFSCQPLATGTWALQTQGVPSITGLAITSTPEAGDEYFLGETITVEVSLDQAVTVLGTPELPLDFGVDRNGNDVKRVALYREGSDTTTLTFEYVIFIGDIDDNGIAIPAGKLQLNNAPTLLSYDGLTEQPAHKVALPVVRMESVEPGEAVRAGDRIRVTVGIDTPVPPLPQAQKENNTYKDNKITGGIIVFDSSVGEEPFADELIAFVFRQGMETRDPGHGVEDTETTGCRTIRIVINRVFPDYQVGHPSEITLHVLDEGDSNNSATGAPTIRGSARVGRTLTARTSSIRDADGLTGVTYSYQWLRVSGGLATVIAGATSASYGLTTNDVGDQLKVRVDFTDDAGNLECLTSAATQTVSSPPPPPPPPPPSTPTPTPTPEPEPTPEPTPEPEPTPGPSRDEPREPEPTKAPVPTAVPKPVPTLAPTAVPTQEPTAVPTPEPTIEPTQEIAPTEAPELGSTETPREQAPTAMARTTQTPGAGSEVIVPTATPTPAPTVTAGVRPTPLFSRVIIPTPRPTESPRPTTGIAASMLLDITPTPPSDFGAISPVVPSTLERPAIPIVGDAIPRIRNALVGIAATPRQRITLIIILGITSLIAVSTFLYLALRRR